MAVQEILLNYLFDDRPHVLGPALRRWIGESPRFVDFVERYRDKIRKKIRSIPDAEGFQDLQAELEAAYVLLWEKRFALAYEPYGKGTGRGPDFEVTFRTRIAFNVEVTRMRFSSREGDEGERPGFDQQYEGYRLADIVGSKLRQLLPSMMNLVMVMADVGAVCEIEVGQVMLRLKQRTEQREAQLFKRHGFRDPADFFKYYQRLSGVLLRTIGDQGGGKCPVLWVNNQAKHPLPGPVWTILGR